MEFPDKESLKERFTQYPDSQLLEILNNHKNYQGLAVQVAKEIAKERGLIHSDQDLLTPGFNQDHYYSRSLFPLLKSKEQADRVLQSLLRVLYLATIVPMVLAVFDYANHKFSEMSVWSCLMIFWGLAVFSLDKKKKTGLVYILYVLFIVFQVLFLASFGPSSIPSVIDVFIYLIAVFLVLYILTYAFIILKRKTKIEE